MNQEKKGKTRLTLEPLRTHGADALDTHDIPSLDKATLTGLEIHFRNKTSGVLIRKSEDLFATTSEQDTQLIPKAATPEQATFELQLAGQNRPHRVTIRPPDTLVLETPADGPMVLQWLDCRSFRQIASLVLIIAIPLAAGLSDGDNDEDDADSDRWSLSA
jgi:hypothetical protein